MASFGKVLAYPRMRMKTSEEGHPKKENPSRLEANPFAIDGYEREITSDLAQGMLIAGGGADAGVGAERVYHQIAGLDYVPLQTERLDLVIAKTPSATRAIRALRGFLGSEMFRNELIALPGYDFAGLGAKLYET